MRQVKKQHFKLKFCIWGPTQILHNATSVQCISQKSLHPIVLYLLINYGVIGAS